MTVWVDGMYILCQVQAEEKRKIMKCHVIARANSGGGMGCIIMIIIISNMIDI